MKSRNIVLGLAALALALAPAAAQPNSKLFFGWAPKPVPLTEWKAPNKPIWRLNEIMAAHKGQADFGKGSPANPMSDDELSEKFRQCAAWGGLDRERANAILALVWKIESLTDVNDLVKLLRK